MDLTIPITLIVVAIIVIIALVLVFRSRRKKRVEAEREEVRIATEEAKRQDERERREHATEDAPVIKWLDGFKAIDPDDTQKQAEYPDAPEEYRDYWSYQVQSVTNTIEYAREDINNAAVEAQMAEDAAVKFNAAKAETNDAAQFIALQQLMDDDTITEYMSDEDYDWAEARIDELEAGVWDQLVEQARAGDRASFKTLRKMKSDDDSYKYPKDWNEIVVVMIKNPTPEDFKGDLDKLRNKLESGDMRLMAIEALKEPSLLKAKIVLALVNDDEKWAHTEVGEPLLTKLGEMVVDAWVEPKPTVSVPPSTSIPTDAP